MTFSKFILLGSLFLLPNLGLFAQDLSISGKVEDQSGNAIDEAQVYLDESNWAITDEEGVFIIEKLQAGNYTLKVSRLGYEEKSQEVNLPLINQEQLKITLEEKIYRDNPIVVTASRTSKELEDVSVPVTVIDGDEITKTGTLRLGEVLDEQIGLSIVSDHGTGIQVQGFDPEYTLILIDNQPIIGRTAGTLDLDRLAVGNIQQIEMVKGPSSALWGSEALAGVINIITDKGSSPFSWDILGRYGTHESIDGSTNLTFKQDRLTGRFFSNFNGSEGYDLDSETLAQTVAQFQNYTFSGGADYRLSKNLTLKLSGRYFREDLNYNSEGIVGRRNEVITGDQFQEDYSITPALLLNIGTRQLFEVTSFFNQYNSATDEVVVSNGNDFYQSTFDQSLNRAEIKSSTFWNSEHTTVFGTGINQEDLTSEIYSDVPGFTSYFAFGQHEWSLQKNLSFTGGFRFDTHSEYSSQFSPKFSGLYKPSDLIHIRASFGGGFKAPTFDQLFLNFTNATVGYSVFGTSSVAEGMESLQLSGQIEQVYIPVTNVTDINAENSISFNAGFDLYPTNQLSFKLNAFRNNVEDMIDTQPIALKKNNQSVFSYFNLDKVYTQGIETEIRYSAKNIEGLRYSLGYQLLDARVQYDDIFDVVENGILISVSEKKYGTLPNRSKHTGNFKIFYTNERLDLDATLRATHRSKFGIDFNGNKRVDEDEYVNIANSFSEAIEKTIINASLSKSFSNKYTIQFGVNNITGFTDELYQPHYPGRTFYTQLNIKLY